MGWRGVDSGCPQKLYLGKRHFFVIEKYIEDVKQEEKDVLDLVESIMRPTDPAKEELRRILSQMGQFRPKIIKIMVSTVWMSGKIPDSRRRLPAGAKWAVLNPFPPYNGSKNLKKFKNMRVSARRGHLH